MNILQPIQAGLHHGPHRGRRGAAAAQGGLVAPVTAGRTSVARSLLKEFAMKPDVASIRPLSRSKLTPGKAEVSSPPGHLRFSQASRSRYISDELCCTASVKLLLLRQTIRTNPCRRLLCGCTHALFQPTRNPPLRSSAANASRPSRPSRTTGPETNAKE